MRWFMISQSKLTLFNSRKAISFVKQAGTWARCIWRVEYSTSSWFWYEGWIVTVCLFTVSTVSDKDNMIWNSWHDWEKNKQDGPNWMTGRKRQMLYFLMTSRGTARIVENLPTKIHTVTLNLTSKASKKGVFRVCYITSHLMWLLHYCYISVAQFLCLNKDKMEMLFFRKCFCSNLPFPKEHKLHVAAPGQLIIKENKKRLWCLHSRGPHSEHMLKCSLKVLQN